MHESAREKQKKERIRIMASDLKEESAIYTRASWHTIYKTVF